MQDGGNPDLDTVFDLLSKPRCRYILYYFLENQHTNVEMLGEQIAAWERGSESQSVADSGHQRITISLLHNHLPRLADHGIVEFDSRSGDVVVADGFAEYRELVSRARTCDDGADIKDEPVDSVLYSDPLEEASTSAPSSN